MRHVLQLVQVHDLLAASVTKIVIVHLVFAVNLEHVNVWKVSLELHVILAETETRHLIASATLSPHFHNAVDLVHVLPLDYVCVLDHN